MTNPVGTPDLEGLIRKVQGLCGTRMELGLDRTMHLLARLGHPEEGRAFVHVAGTNGKGSVTAMMESVLHEAGYRVGSFVSPHLVSYTERIRIAREPISAVELAGLLADIVAHLDVLAGDGLAPTEFEAYTAAALLHFARARADLALLEVGLGGRLDATNVVVPEVAVITNVSEDHTAVLGSGIAGIAREKAGIIKKGVPVVTAATGIALEVVSQVAHANSSPLVVIDRDVTWSMKEDGADRVVDITGRLSCYRGIRLGLRGAHQAANAACAVAALEILMEKGWAVDAEHLRRGLSSVKWPGRFEVFQGAPRIILDGAHNPAGASVLAQEMTRYAAGDKAVLLLGILDDKPREAMARTLAGIAKGAVVTRPPGPRSERWADVAEIVGGLGITVAAVEDPLDAFQVARKLAGPEGTVLVAGSLYLVGGIRRYLTGQKDAGEVYTCNTSLSNPKTS